MEDQKVRVIEGGCQARPQGSTRFGPDMIAWAGRIFAAQRPGRVAAIRALTGGGGDRGIDRSRYLRRAPGRSKALGVERRAHRLAMQTGDEHGQREAFGGADPGKRLRLEKRAKAGLYLLAC